MDDPELKTVFDKFSLQRSKFAGELQSEVVNLGEPDPEDSSSVTGSMHRAWINVKSAVTSGDRHAHPRRSQALRRRRSQRLQRRDGKRPARAGQRHRVATSHSGKNAHDKIRALRDSAAQK